ncbi:MAG: ribose 5-phosphate isomerase B [Thermoleophilia bacterium]|nr:ribose 5-phosphate isomerase B [Thermoleophilia bacterium]
MRYGFGCDHAGFELKALLIEELTAAGHEVVDMGTDSGKRTDFPIYANRVAEALSDGRLDRGVLVCGTGLGMALAAGKYPDVRAVTVGDCYSARMSRRHNDANILCLGARVIGAGLAVEILRAWMDEDFEGGHYAERLEMMKGGYKGVCR